MSKGGGEEFSTNITSKEERIRVRKRRIDKRNATEANGNDDVVEAVSGSNKTGSQQVTDSLFHLDRRKYTGLKDVTALRVTTDENESKRRLNDESLRRDRLAKLQQEALASAKANAAVEMKWAEIHEKEIPQELYSDIQAQTVACTAIIRSKDELITEFQRQLRTKDEEYVRTLRQQGEDVEELLTRIRKEFKEMQNEYDKELETIEEAYSDERDRMIQDHVNEIDNMFDMRKTKEIYYKETKQKREEQYQRELDDLITKGADQYNKLKIELELNIQTLKQQLEEIRATYQLNTEKLDYNYRVLTELDVEKNAELTRYKRRLTKLKDQLNQLVTKFTEMEAADTKMNHELTEDYRSLTQKYKDLQAKFRHFEVADTNKYDEVWVMHEDEAKDLVDQLLKADKIIAEQQLNWRWQGPDMYALQQVLGRHGTLGLAVGANNASAGAGSNNAGAGGSGGGVGDEVDAAAAAAATSSNTPVDGSSTNNSSEPKPFSRQQSVKEKERKVASTRIRGVLKMLAIEAGFLVNEQVMKSIESIPTEGEDNEYVNLSKAEVLLKALGVKSEDKLNTLVSYFFKDNPHGAAVATDDMYGTNDEDAYDEDEELNLHHAPEDVAELRDMIKAEDVIAAVKTYIEDVMVDGPVGAPVASARAREEEERIKAKRLNSIKNYWVHLSQVVSDETVEVWKQLEKDYTNLKELLGKRSQMIRDVDEMNARNAEMKKLLNQYLGDVTANSGLQIPPAQVMKVRNVPVVASKANNNKGAAGIPTSNALFSQTGKVHPPQQQQQNGGRLVKDAMRATR